MTRVYQDIMVSIIGMGSLQKSLVTSTIANDFLLSLIWFLSIGRRMIVMSKDSTAHVAITIIDEDGIKTFVKDVFSYDLIQILEGLKSKN